MPYVFLILAVYAAAALETSLAPLIELRHVGPDLLALAALMWLMMTCQSRGFLAVAVVGLLSDLTSAGPLGVGMAVFALAGYGIVALRGRLDLDHFIVRLTVLWLAVTAIALAQGVAWKLTSETSLSWPTLAVRGVTIGVYTAAVGLPLLTMIHWRRPSRSTVAATP